MPLLLNNVHLSDEDIKQIIGEQYLNLILLGNHIKVLQFELSKGYNMKVIKNPNGTILLEPEGNELEILQWINQRHGSTFIKDKIQELIDQRKAQRDWDELNEIHNDFKQLSETDRNTVKNLLKTEINTRKPK